jgi:hypothetical protein
LETLRQILILFLYEPRSWTMGPRPWAKASLKFYLTGNAVYISNYIYY